MVRSVAGEPSQTETERSEEREKIQRNSYEVRKKKIYAQLMFNKQNEEEDSFKHINVKVNPSTTPDGQLSKYLDKYKKTTNNGSF